MRRYVLFERYIGYSCMLLFVIEMHE